MNKLKAEIELKEMLKINNWYCTGINLIGGNIGLFYKIGWKRIKELYNINYE